MTGNLTFSSNYSVDLMKLVHGSLEALRTSLQSGRQDEDTRGKIQQLEQLEHLLMDQAARLDAINRVLDEFNYSVAHELFAPLRRITGFTRELQMRYSEQVEADGIDCFNSILSSTHQMNDLIDALMQLSRMSHVELQPTRVEVSAMADEIAEELTVENPQRRTVVSVAPQLSAVADPTMLKIALRKLLENAWKFTAPRDVAEIELGALAEDDGEGFYLRDNGVGFDMAEYGRLFHPFQRLHDPDLFPGNGIGLTTVKRIVERHGGRIWAEGAPLAGAIFRFTLPQQSPPL
jgi:light-regulated signal transduction histidine kinase (bacteriophytochrome)